jgi:hypothetical protein
MRERAGGGGLDPSGQPVPVSRGCGGERARGHSEDRGWGRSRTGARGRIGEGARGRAGEDEDRSVRGPVDGRSWLSWVIDNMVWTDSWLSIAGAWCGLICVGAGEERARKVYALLGLRGVERQVGSARGTRCPAGSSAGRMVARKARRSHGQEPVQGRGSRLESARGVCDGSPQNRQVTWLSHKTKNGGSAGRDGIQARREASMPADT